MIDRPPKIVGFTADPYEHFVEMPAPLRVGPHTSGTLLLDRGRKQGTEPVPPGSRRLVADIDPAFLKQILNLTQRQRKSDIHHHRQADHLGRGLEVPEGISHPRTLRDAFSAFKRFSLTLPAELTAQDTHLTCQCRSNFSCRSASRWQNYSLARIKGGRRGGPSIFWGGK